MNPDAFFRRVEQQPWGFDFYQALRRIEALYATKPRLGRAPRPIDEAIRLAQEPSLAFPISALSAFEAAKGNRPPRLFVRFLGLLGPNGPLPLHLTEFVRERILHQRDRTFARFLDVIHHRFLLMFYRAWAQAQPTVSLDRPKEDRFRIYTGALFGVASPALMRRDAIGDFAKLHLAGLLSRQVRNVDGLKQAIAAYFRIPVRIEQFVGHWMRLPRDERTRLGRQWGTLGRDIVIGASCWDRQHKIRIHLGPLARDQYEAFLPGAEAARQLAAWLRFYLDLEFFWDVRLVLARREVPRTRLGARGEQPVRLGWTTWLGSRRKPGDADDLIVDLERPPLTAVA